MTDYNYMDAMENDIKEYIKNEINFTEFETLEELEEYLNDTLWTEDSVTGNASGSYTYNTYQAEEYLCHNWDVLEEALNEFGCYDINPIEKGAEWCDVAIRCYLLSSAIADVMKELEEDFDACHDEKEVE